MAKVGKLSVYFHCFFLSQAILFKCQGCVCVRVYFSSNENPISDAPDILAIVGALLPRWPILLFVFLSLFLPFLFHVNGCLLS